jgi:superfamily II DNA or RNA helicase
MDTKFKEAFDYKVIYVFTILDEAHKGLLKIGDATVETESPIDKLPPNCHELNQAALKRIRSYTNTAGLNPKLLHTELAVRQKKNKDGSIANEAFRDHQVHDVLKNSGIRNVKFDGSTGQEWYKIDLETAIKAIEAVKNNYANLSNSTSFASKHTPIIFRPEQEDCIKKAVKHFKKADRFLVNAKMRYGKTLVSLEIIKECKFNKTIIMTHRPVVNAGWYEDFTKIFYDESDIIYGSKDNGYTVEKLLNTGKRFIYFASIQDLRGSSEVGGKFNKNDAVFSMHWDCVIVDEAHEGTTTALGEETVKAVVKEGSGTKFLALSGTPFNILTDYDENSIYTWDYIMEQECKYGWDEKHFGDHNPYDDLPELRIYTYSLGDILHNSNYITYEDKAFNFREFFRTFTGDYKADYADMPEGAEVGDFVHEADVWSFLNLMTKEDEQSGYPYSNEEYRNIFKHSLWMVPGVREARALKKLMLKHPVFGSGQFDIVNVAGNGDQDEESEDALKKVKNAIRSAKKSGTYTITLSCGKLTTGVTVKDWTAVFMLAGSYSTSAANYLQTIFRVQSPCSDNGKVKDRAYVFDFAPDRTLKMISSAVQVSSKAGKTKESDRRIMGKFLNYCPVISVSGSQMHEYSTNRLLQQLKRAYADKVVRNGFDDSKLYNDELFKLDKVDIEKFDKLKGIIGTSKAAPKANDITVNDQGLTDEEYEEQEKLKKKKKKDLTPEEKARLEELNKKKKVRSDAISILRGISIRMPLLIYGADIPYDEEVTLDKLVDIVDDSSWEEFMPNGITKRVFKDFQKYYDEEVFIAAGRRIRNISREADTLEPTERVKKIAGLFSYFKNPDKETVLTPWRVVNMHMSDCLGGWCFYDESFEEDKKLDEPRFVDRGQVTADVFGKLDTRILEINSKTGLYPLYVTYSAYRRRLRELGNKELNVQELQKIWLDTVRENIFVICKTPMAKAITKRTLVGYADAVINAHYFDDLINTMKNKPQQFVKRVLKESYWKKGIDEMNFDAIVGNPPYQNMDGGNKSSASPIYHYFIEQAKSINPHYLSMIVPAKWYSGGKGLDAFRKEMLSDRRIVKIFDFSNSLDVFNNVDIAGGICYFLWDNAYNGKCLFTNHSAIGTTSIQKYLDEYDVLIRYPLADSIIRKILNKNESKLSEVVSSRKPFGLATNVKPQQEGDLTLRYTGGTGPYRRADVKVGIDIIDKWKVMISYLSAEHAGQPDKNGQFKVLSTTELLPPKYICTETYLIAGYFDTENEAVNYYDYLKTKFVRFLIGQVAVSQHITKNSFMFVPSQDFSKEWNDEQLFEKYGLSNNEIHFIDSMIKPMD